MSRALEAKDAVLSEVDSGILTVTESPAHELQAPITPHKGHRPREAMRYPFGGAITMSPHWREGRSQETFLRGVSGVSELAIPSTRAQFIFGIFWVAPSVPQL